MVATEHLRRELVNQGFDNLVMWTRGVDIDLFRPRTLEYLQSPRPIMMYVGRVAVEKKSRGVPVIAAFRNEVCDRRRSGTR